MPVLDENPLVRGPYILVEASQLKTIVHPLAFRIGSAKQREIEDFPENFKDQKRI
jgi:hypothetical protein